MGRIKKGLGWGVEGQRPMIAFYITAHGYGHAARSLEVIEALLEHHLVTIVSQVPERFFRPRLGEALRLRPKAFDCGLIQLDSVRGDVAASLTANRRLMSQAPLWIEEERQFFRDSGVELVVVDAPALPLEAAAAEDIPGLALTNFGWDYIYAQFAETDPNWVEVCDWFKRGYSKATHQLQYPFSATIESISSREEVPLVSRPGLSRRNQIARETGADPGKPWVLVWFHQLELDPILLEQLPFEFFTVSGLDWATSNCRVFRGEFADAVASVDVVLSKPGFGILSDCMANGKPLVYVPRSDFRESQLLELSIQRYLAHARVSPADLYAGRWAPSLQAALAAARPTQSLPTSGAAVIAQRVLSFLAR